MLRKIQNDLQEISDTITSVTAANKATIKIIEKVLKSRGVKSTFEMNFQGEKMTITLANGRRYSRDRDNFSSESRDKMCSTYVTMPEDDIQKNLKVQQKHKINAGHRRNTVIFDDDDDRDLQLSKDQARDLAVAQQAEARRAEMDFGFEASIEDLKKIGASPELTVDAAQLSGAVLMRFSL